MKVKKKALLVKLNAQQTRLMQTDGCIKWEKLRTNSLESSDMVQTDSRQSFIIIIIITVCVLQTFWHNNESDRHKSAMRFPIALSSHY